MLIELDSINNVNEGRCKLFMNENNYLWTKEGFSLNPEEERKHFIRFFDWISLNSGWWRLICTPGDKNMTPDMMKLLLRRLIRERLYEPAFVLLTVHRRAAFADRRFKDTLLSGLTAVTGFEPQEKKRIVEYAERLLK